jgi:hypothetical protein
MATQKPALATKVEVAGPRDGITIKKIEQKINDEIKKFERVDEKMMSRKNKKRTTIQGYDFTVDKGTKHKDKQLSVTDCEEVVVQYCKFRKKTTTGRGLSISGKKTKKVTVQYCIFEDFPKKEKGEPLGLGNSEYSGCIFECEVKNNIFRKLKGDPECISIKSCKNTITDNFFIDNKSNVTVRHGGLNLIQHNYFRGNCGVRIHGYGNHVEYNCFEDNKDDRKLSPITVRYGKVPKDPNWKNFNKPSEEEGDGHDEYAETIGTIIKGNEFKNCTNKIKKFKGDKDGPKPPKDTKENDNKEVKKFAFETRD